MTYSSSPLTSFSRRNVPDEPSTFVPSTISRDPIDHTLPLHNIPAVTARYTTSRSFQKVINPVIGWKSAAPNDPALINWTAANSATIVQLRAGSTRVSLALRPTSGYLGMAAQRAKYEVPLVGGYCVPIRAANSWKPRRPTLPRCAKRRRAAVRVIETRHASEGQQRDTAAVFPEPRAPTHT